MEKNFLIVNAQYIESFAVTMAREIIMPKFADKKSQVKMYHIEEASSNSQEELQNNVILIKNKWLVRPGWH